MNRFNIAKKGYDKEEVDEYVSRQDKQYQNTLREQSMRIEELKAKVADLERSLAECKEKEDNVNEALLTAIEKAKEIDSTTKIRFALEGERIKLFEQKWTLYCQKKMRDLKIKNEVEEYLNEIEREIFQIMNEDLNIGSGSNLSDLKEVEKQYLKETERLQNSKAKSPAADLTDPYEQEYEESNCSVDGFNLDDLDNPPTLADLCRQLGLYQ